MTYTLDVNDVIIAIEPGAGDTWTAEVPREKVLGTRLLSHVSGVSTAAFIQGVLDIARRGHRVEVPYRCDTPARRRSWTMEVSAGEEGRIHLSHRLIEDLPHQLPITFRTATAHFVNAVPRCSVCNRVFTDTAWRDPEDQGLKSFWRSRVVEVVYEVCSTCDALTRPLMSF